MKEKDFKSHKVSNKDASNNSLKQQKASKANQPNINSIHKEFSTEVKIPQRKKREDDTIDPNIIFFIVLMVIFLLSYLYFSNFYFV